eukprot:TRINITY_DN3171_c1_g1_i1.p1 TRINITY_DN3171_c1_g1~~TRINITY_DN3171_c1_g1_i1.p1  ORF type:complete len:367 (+),score=67.31 TRINITY_DN3171_c1_g1_i1:124-1224(+)
MVVQRLWNFAKRHKKKLIFSGLAAGGAYYAWNYWLPRFQQRMLENLLKELTEQSANGTPEQDAKERKEARFRHQQEVSDNYVRKGLQAFQMRFNSCFDADAFFTKVREAKTRETKLASFQELQVECLTMVCSSLYSLHALLLLHRVEFNITGRELAATEQRTKDPEAPSEEETVFSKFLESMEYFQERGASSVAEAVRSAVRTCMEKSGLTPQTLVTEESLTSFFHDVCVEVDSKLLLNNKAADTLLPPDSSDGTATKQLTQVKCLLDEARDYLESPQLVQVFQAVRKEGSLLVVKQLTSVDEKVAPGLSNGGSVPLAKIFGGFITLSKSLLDSDREGDTFIKKFAEQNVVDQLCRGLYFQTSSLL